MKRKLRSVIIIAVLALVVAAIMPHSASAATISYGSRDATMYMQYYSSGWMNMDTPEHFLMGSSPEQVAYCVQHRKASPSSGGSSYTDTNILGTYSMPTQIGLLIILEQGYPFETSGLSASEARYATANAIRFWLSEREFYEGGRDDFYNYTDLHEYNSDQLRAMAAGGTIGSKVRTRSGYNNGVLQFAIELLIKARNQEGLNQSVSFSTPTLNLNINGGYYEGSTTVYLENCKRYDINTSSFPPGTQVLGYTGNHGDVLTIRIPISAANSGVSYGISATGKDDRTLNNIFVNQSIGSPQDLTTVTKGESYYRDVDYKTMTVITPALPDLTITSVWPSASVSSSVPTIKYQTHVESIGWQEWKQNGAVSGTNGQNYRVEAINIDIAGADSSIEYRTHVQDIGWMDWVNEGGMSGTTGEAKKIEALEIRLKGSTATNYDVYYRAHVQEIGWQSWVKNGATAGTSGQSLRLEAIQIVIVQKGAGAPGPITVNSGETVTVTVAVTNCGNSAVSSAVVQLTPNGLSAQTKTVSLGAGQSTNVTFTFTAPNYSSNTNMPIVAKVDPSNAIKESNESNNQGSTSVNVLALPDLTVSSLTTNKTVYNPGETVTVTATIKNTGNITAAASVVKMAPNGLSAQTKSIGSLGAGQSTTVTFTFTAPSYTSNTNMSIMATADSTNVVAEVSETNNQRSTSITIQALPDLIVSTLTTDKTTYDAGEIITVKASVKNQGYSTAAASTLTIAPNGYPAMTAAIPALSAGATSAVQTFTFTAASNLTATSINIVATADSKNVVQELIETNNTKSTTVTVNALLSDLTFGDDSTIVSSYYEGKDIVISAQVRNLSAQGVPSVEVKLQLGSATKTETICVPGKGINIVVFRITAPMATGTYPVLLTIDPDNKIAETNENNNKTNEDGTIKYDGSVGAVKTGAIALARNDLPDPADTRMEDDHLARNKSVPALPTLAKSSSHTWTEYRYENGVYVQKSYSALLSTTFEIKPDPRVAIKDHPDMMESGFGVSATATTRLTTNYDHPEKLVGPQMYWAYYPETNYWTDSDWSQYADALEYKSGAFGQVGETSWQYAVSPYSVTDSRLHYTPVWFPDDMYEAVGQSFYGWSPAGQMYSQVSDTVEIEGDMYDRFPVLNR